MTRLAFVIVSILALANAGPETSTSSINLTDTGTYVEQLTALEAKLLQNYNRNVRPVKNDTTRTQVKFYAVIQHIEEVDEIEQAMTVHGFMYWEWKDEYMTWDKSAYNGVDRFTLHGWYLWKPDIVLYNTGAGIENARQVNQYQHVWIQSDGRAMYFSFFSFRATCIFDFTDYPYDTQLCPLIMGSWSYTLREMEIVPYSEQAGVVLAWNSTKTIVSGWELVSSRVNASYWNAYTKARGDEKPSEDAYAQSFTEINVWLKLRRHAPYFGIVVLLPAVMSSFFTLAAFWTVSTVQGVAVLLVNLLIQAVFTDDLLQKIPPSTGTVPRIVRYYAFNLISTVLAIILLMIFKTIENLDRSIPVGLATAVRTSHGLRTSLGDRLGFRRHADEIEEEHTSDEQAANDDEEDEANRQQQKSQRQQQQQQHKDTTAIAWVNVAGLIKFITFTLYLIFYLGFMFAWLC